MPAKKCYDKALFSGKATAVVINYFLSGHSCMAEIYRGISRSSVPVELSAPTTGLILNSERVSLKPHRLNKLVFSHDNFDSLQLLSRLTRLGQVMNLNHEMMCFWRRTSSSGTDGLCKYVQVIFAKLY
jgi:hypothetical protein